MDFLSRLLNYTFEIGDFTIKMSAILYPLLILIAARILIWLVIRILKRIYRRNHTELGTQYAINQLVKYFIYTMALVTALQFVGVTLTALWASLAALAVGIGLGLQQTFNDLVSGIILLIEGSVEVGHAVEMGDLVGEVTNIGLRTSEIKTARHINVIVPNSKLVTDNVINWSHRDNKVLFSVQVGVAYGSDTQMIKKLLIESAEKHSLIMNSPNPFVRFSSFGDSSLDFELLFYTNKYLQIDNIQSDLRFMIDKAFRENEIEIPFPQRDIWIKK